MGENDSWYYLKRKMTLETDDMLVVDQGRMGAKIVVNTVGEKNREAQ